MRSSVESRAQNVSARSISVGTKILDLAGTVFEVDDLWIAGEEHEVVRGSGRNGEAVGERYRRSGLKARDLNHPGGAWKIKRERRPKVTECVISCI